MSNQPPIPSNFTGPSPTQTPSPSSNNKDTPGVTPRPTEITTAPAPVTQKKPAGPSTQKKLPPNNQKNLQKKKTQRSPKSHDEYNHTPVGSLGLAESTIKAKANAIRIGNIYNRFKKFPVFEKMTYDFLENNLEEYLETMVSFFCSNPFAREFGDNFVPVDPNSKNMMMISTIKINLGQWKECLRDKFPQHPQWPQEKSKNPKFWTTVMDNGEKNWSRLYNEKWKNDPDLVFGGVQHDAVYL